LCEHFRTTILAPGTVAKSAGVAAGAG
jgi:hypothetical protein